MVHCGEFLFPYFCSPISSSVLERISCSPVFFSSFKVMLEMNTFASC